ncbi:predicted protein [Naegleria gruberi]|uniref:Predicted protein n=1 Tax=Naegleria gruberi TaxID=5762 RepID=D2V9P7_NAEGR|nr:uncharacterized protein NAEGRDRAFT_65513 [Naegleria gruberi]EFC46624.1 predicted protein [Naegleria gruberi]|eukprot:XP_002679368.1 predicted protein [Naegleria gruberi strain NEG-M]
MSNNNNDKASTTNNNKPSSLSNTVTIDDDSNNNNNNNNITSTSTIKKSSNIGMLTREEKQSFEELIDFCSHNNEQVRITGLSNLLKFLRIEEYLNNLRFTIRVLEKCIKTLVNLTSDKSHFVSKLSISCLILLSQDESTIFFNEMVKNDLIQILMNIFIKMERRELNNELNQNDKDTLECILLLLSNLTSNSEQARLKFLNMKTIEETLKKLKKANLKSNDSDDSDDDSDTESDSDSDSDNLDELKEYNIMKLINYFNRPMNELKISLISSHLIPTILGNLSVNDHAKYIIVNNNCNISYLHLLLFKNNNLDLLNNLDIQQDKCLRRRSILAILKNCLFKKNLIPNIIYANDTNLNLFDLLYYQLNSNFPIFIQQLTIECLQLISDLPFGLEYLHPYLDKLIELNNSNLDQIIQAIQTRNLVKPGTLIKIDENGQMINLNTFNEDLQQHEHNINNINNNNNSHGSSHGDDNDGSGGSGEKNFDDLD